MLANFLFAVLQLRKTKLKGFYVFGLGFRG